MPSATQNNMEDGKIWQPLHPEVRPLLDSQYVKLHDEVLQYIMPDEQREWDGTRRLGTYGLPRNSAKPIPVGSDRIVTIPDTNLRIRIFTPSTDRDVDRHPDGWPVFLWFHGGGHALGDLDSDEEVLTRICEYAQCVVCNVDYRLAPEHPYPAAIDDCVAALRWLVRPDGGVKEVGLDKTKVAIGGASAGGHLTIATLLRCAQENNPPDLNIIKQVLVVPVIDNTATPENGPFWSLKAHTAPWLTPSRMLWYRNMWLHSQEQCEEWQASVNRAPVDLLARLPPAFMAVAGEDLLCPEALDFAEKIRAVGVDVEVKEFDGCTHALLGYSAAWIKAWSY
ncbi:hypothetical protein MCOR25_005158 [Pyricularia grisea]|nr:hypothetical protein MCOR25_005158 [Pyricularia grisea]